MWRLEREGDDSTRCVTAQGHTTWQGKGWERAQVSLEALTAHRPQLKPSGEAGV